MSLKKFLRSRERFIHVSVPLQRHEVTDENTGVVHVLHLPKLRRGITRCTTQRGFNNCSNRTRVLMTPHTNDVVLAAGR